MSESVAPGGASEKHSVFLITPNEEKSRALPWLYRESRRPPFFHRDKTRGSSGQCNVVSVQRGVYARGDASVALSVTLDRRNGDDVRCNGFGVPLRARKTPLLRTRRVCVNPDLSVVATSSENVVGNERERRRGNDRMRFGSMTSSRPPPPLRVPIRCEQKSTTSSAEGTPWPCPPPNKERMENRQ